MWLEQIFLPISTTVLVATYEIARLTGPLLALIGPSTSLVLISIILSKLVKNAPKDDFIQDNEINLRLQ